MFNNNGKNTPSKNGSNAQMLSTSIVNSLGHGTVIDGSITAETDIRIDGEVKGNIICRGKLILGESGNINGDVDCHNALIEGSITGTIKVKELLHVKETAKIDGDISTGELMVQPGAVFNVNCNMGNSSSSSVSKSFKKETKPAETLSLEEVAA